MAKQIDDEQVYEAVLLTLLENGYAGSTTKRIAKKAGMNEVTLFRKYGSKSELVAAAVAHQRFKFDHSPVEYTGDAAADLAKMVSFHSGVTAAHAGQLFPLIMSEMVRYPELRETMRVPHEQIRAFGAIIAKYQADGVIRAGDPVLMVTTLLGPAIVNNMLRSANPELEMPPLDIADLVDRFLNGNRG